jgi:hypothetical protein
MKESKYICPHCQTYIKSDISFLRIEGAGTPGEKAIFFCHVCQREFKVGGLEREYLPNLVAVLKEDYPPKKRNQSSCFY